MANFNKVLLMGNLTRDPETKFLPSGAGVVEFGLAINRTWTDQQSGEKREATTFVDCKAWGKQGEILSRYCKKGSALFVEGRLDYRTWETNGEKRSKHEIVVENFQFVGAPKGMDRAAEPRWGAKGRRVAAAIAVRHPDRAIPNAVRIWGRPSPPDTTRGPVPTTSRSDGRGRRRARLSTDGVYFSPCCCAEGRVGSTLDVAVIAATS